MPNVPISCLPPRRVNTEVQGLKVIIDCPQPGSSWATYRPPPIRRCLSVAAMTRWWSCLGAVRARCPKKLSRSNLTQPDTGEQAVMLSIVSLVVCLLPGVRNAYLPQAPGVESITDAFFYVSQAVLANMIHKFRCNSVLQFGDVSKDTLMILLSAKFWSRISIQTQFCVTLRYLCVMSNQSINQSEFFNVAKIAMATTTSMIT